LIVSGAALQQNAAGYPRWCSQTRLVVLWPGLSSGQLITANQRHRLFYLLRCLYSKVTSALYTDSGFQGPRVSPPCRGSKEIQASTDRAGFFFCWIACGDASFAEPDWAFAKPAWWLRLRACSGQASNDHRGLGQTVGCAPQPAPERVGQGQSLTRPRARHGLR